MKRVRLVDSERRKPLSYDPARGVFLYLDDLGRGEIPGPGTLPDHLKTELVLKRYDIEADSSIESLAALDKRQQMEHVLQGTELGLRLVSQEITFLEELIEKIRSGVVF